jgi:choline dehydrogenase
MLSGVGPSEHLKQHGIPIVHDLPGVGSNLVDHPVVDFYFKDKLGLSTKFMKPKTTSDAVQFAFALFQYKLFRRGPLATNVSTSLTIQKDPPHWLLWLSLGNRPRFVDRMIQFFSLLVNIPNS